VVDDLAAEFRHRPAGQRPTASVGQSTRERLDFDDNDDAGRKTGWSPASRLLLEAR